MSQRTRYYPNNRASPYGGAPKQRVKGARFRHSRCRRRAIRPFSPSVTHNPRALRVLEGSAMKTRLKLFVGLVLVSVLSPIPRADEVTDWNSIMLDSLRTAGVGGVLATRPAATVQTAVFDALNGIERRYGWIRVEPAAPRGASRRAAVVQAAYASLAQLFPAQQATLNAHRTTSLAAIASGEAAENSESIARGIQWGQTVANAIVAWRAADGFTPPPPPNFGALGIGQWRPTAPGFAPFAAVQLGSTACWVIPSAAQFTLAGPPALTSTRYATEFNEVKSVGQLVSATRTADQTLIARFWASASSPNYSWNRLATQLGAQRHTTMSENARILALMNLAMADTGIVVWRLKLHYNFWRPETAIQFAAADGNTNTTADPTWLPLLTTPPYPDYPSGLCGLAGAAAAVLADYFDENSSFQMTSDAPAMAGVVRTFPNFTAALNEAIDSRIYAGIHFRSADADAVTLGGNIAHFILANSAQPLHGRKVGQLRD